MCMSVTTTSLFLQEGSCLSSAQALPVLLVSGHETMSATMEQQACLLEANHLHFALLVHVLNS